MNVMFLLALYACFCDAKILVMLVSLLPACVLNRVLNHGFFVNVLIF